MTDFAELRAEQERAVFEAVFAEIYDIRTRALGHFDRDKFGNYVNDRVGTSWRMWKARALLSENGAATAEAYLLTGTDARWYAVGADGQATLCINREDARDTAAEAAQLYPNNAPYTAVQMVPVGEGDVFGRAR